MAINMSILDASKYAVDDVKTGIMNGDYLMAVLDEIGSRPAKCFIYDDVNEKEDIDLIAYFIVLFDELEEDLIMSIADKISFKDFMFVVINLVEQHYKCEELTEKYEYDMQKMALEMFMLEQRLNYQRLNKPLFKELCSVNYNVFHNTMYDAIAKYSPEEDMDTIEKLRSAGQKNAVKEKTLGDFWSYVHKTMTQHWVPSTNLQDFKRGVLNGHRIFLKEILMPLAFAMNADVMDSQTFYDVIEKYS